VDMTWKQVDVELSYEEGREGACGGAMSGVGGCITRNPGRWTTC